MNELVFYNDAHIVRTLCALTSAEAGVPPKTTPGGWNKCSHILVCESVNLF